MAKILLVEDDSNLREIYGARLEAEGYTIISAADGEEALAAAVKELPDLIISDVMMPKISGFDMLDILRSTPETKDVKVIVMTALSQEEDRERGEKLGADKYLVKSQVTLDDVVQMVRDLLGDNGAPAAAPFADDSATTDAPADQTVQDDTTQPAPTGDLHNEVADFVATSPLMNGAAPSEAPQAPAQPADALDQFQQPQPPIAPQQ
jgi:DNA-binding response OmpR family regulator